MIFKSGFDVIWSVNEREWVALSNTAHVDSPFDFEVPLDTPSRSPGVLDVPKVLSAFVSVSGGQDRVVDVLGSLSAIVNAVNTSVVVLESADDLEGDWNWSLVPQLFGQLLLISLGNIVASESDVSDGNVSSEVALSVLGSVWISQVAFDTSGMSNVLEGMGWKTTLAAVVVEISRTVNELLFWESYVSSFTKNVPVGFKGADSWEGPAWTALSLVLDWGDQACGCPFVSSGNGDGLLLNFQVLGGGTLLWSHEFVGLEFFECHVREVINALSPWVFSFVVLSDFLQCVNEDLESVLTFLVMSTLELRVDFSGNWFLEDTVSVQEASVLHVEMKVAQTKCGQPQHKEDF